jgi:hypothetical protein
VADGGDGDAKGFGEGGFAAGGLEVEVEGVFGGLGDEGGEVEVADRLSVGFMVFLAGEGRGGDSCVRRR